jgi:quercetin dioxygenase-like cupin family protein
MYFFNPKERESRSLMPGATMKTFWGERILVSLVEMAPNEEVPAHSHPHEQMGVVLQGQIDMRIGNERRILKRGDVYLAPSGVEHWVKAGPRPVKVIDIFSPVREEYKY